MNLAQIIKNNFKFKSSKTSRNLRRAFDSSLFLKDYLPQYVKSDKLYMSVFKKSFVVRSRWLLCIFFGLNLNMTNRL